MLEEGEALKLNDGAGERASYPVDRLDLGDDQFAELVHVGGRRPDDYVVRTGDVVGGLYAVDVTDLARHVARADSRLYEHVRSHAIGHLKTSQSSSSGPRV